MKYKLSDILFSMNPCSEATEWITHHMHFETLEEAVQECPFYSWLFWVVEKLDGTCPEGTQLYEEAARHRAAFGAVDFLYRPDVMERLAYVLILYAKKKGIQPA